MDDVGDFTNRSLRVNLVLRGHPSDATKLTAFGFLLDVPPDLMEKSGGRDVHLVAEVYLMKAGSKVLLHTCAQSPEDILEQGIPAFNSDAHV